DTHIRYYEIYKGVTSDYESTYSSGIKDVAARIDFDYVPAPGHYIRFGISDIVHRFNPGVMAYVLDASGSINNNTSLNYGGNVVYTQEQGVYAEDDYQFTKRIKLNAGLHLSGFAVQDQWYKSIQPRLSFNYMVNNRFSIKAAYSDMTQYLHLLSNSNVGLPTDLWLPSTNRVAPMDSKQYALGFVHAIGSMYELSIESYYKTMKGMIEYKEGAVYWGQFDDWQDKIESGDGWAYGSEFLLQKKTGKTTGWIGYTLSWNNRRFANINSGKTFPARYDQRHDINIVVNHQFSPKVDMGLTWVYSSGTAFTLNAEEFLFYSPDKQQSGNIIQSAGTRDGFRMPSYHRLDLGFNFHRKRSWGERIWRIGVYNLYSRRNPFFIYTKNETTLDKSDNLVQNISFKQVSLFPIIPSITYSFNF
ncbi:MAG: TonB-dependent receptor, partial [Bacteroidota bacterium]|nr:TonB-dependent receptor [Bacteroidota bacterium]